MARIVSGEGRIIEFRTLSTVLVVFALLVAGVSVGGARMDVQDTTSQTTTIDSCTTITEPGAYRLTDSIENSTADVCIDIQASDVRFDGNGYTVDGNITRQAVLERLAGPLPSEGIGIGVNLGGSSSVSNVTITDATASDWFLGVLVRNASDASVHNVTSTASGIGVLLDATTETHVERSTASNNVNSGIFVAGSSDRRGNNTITNTTASQNDRYGVLILDSPSSTVRNVTANGNTFTGFEIVNSSYTTVQNVTATDNEFRGFGVDAFPGYAIRNVTVADSNFSENGYIGMAVFATTDSTFTNNSVVGTRGALPPDRSPPVPSTGVVVDFGSEGNVFADTDARNQAEWAYIAVNSGPNTVENLRTDAVTVSFDGQNIALGPSATVSKNATDAETALLPGGLTVTNMSADAFVNLQVTWETAESEDQPRNETTTVSRAR